MLLWVNSGKLPKSDLMVIFLQGLLQRNTMHFHGDIIAGDESCNCVSLFTTTCKCSDEKQLMKVQEEIKFLCCYAQLIPKSSLLSIYLCGKARVKRKHNNITRTKSC